MIGPALPTLPALVDVALRIGGRRVVWLLQRVDATVVIGACVLLWVLRAAAVRYAAWAWPRVYLLAFATYEAPERNRVSRSDFRRMQRRMGCYTADSLEFMDKMVDRTGLGDATAAPDGALADPPQLTITAAREESAQVMFDCVERVLKQTHTAPRDVDILIVNCSLFNPTPSLTAMVINRFRLKDSVQSYNLSGMGCSAGLIAVHLAKQLLAVHRNTTALVVSTENLTQSWYRGNEREMLIPNTLFRVGGAAVLMSNKFADRSRAKYRLLHTVRTHLGADDEAYGCIFQAADAQGIVGVRLTKSVAAVANRALTRNLTALAPKILTYAQLMAAAVHELRRAWRKRFGAKTGAKPKADADVPQLIAATEGVTPTSAPAAVRRGTAQVTVQSPYPHARPMWSATPTAAQTKAAAASAVAAAPAVATNGGADAHARATAAGGGADANAPYVPDLTRCIQHFCVHAGGRGVLDALQKGLRLPDAAMHASRDVLQRFGNTSSSSVWYELQHHERAGRVKPGDNVWQLAFGSGFKCNSAVWQAM